jgi:hypothetical protein
MSLVVAHGVPKSGSTFLYQVAKDITEAINGFSHYEAKNRFFPGMEVPDFVAQPEDAFVDSLLERLPPGAAFVFKTHGRITPKMASRLRSGRVKAMMSFRDPRDTAISMLDAGVKDREKGRDRSFAALHEVEQAIGPTRHGWRIARDWIDCPNLLLIPYYLTATNQRWVVDRLCDYLGAAWGRYRINAKYAHGKDAKITEFHKGVADRFLDDLTPSQIERLGEKLAREIDEVDALTARWMGEYGFRLLHRHLKDERDRKLASLREEPPTIGAA